MTPRAKTPYFEVETDVALLRHKIPSGFFPVRVYIQRKLPKQFLNAKITKVCEFDIFHNNQISIFLY